MYPIGPPCRCGHGESCHDIGTRRGVKVRTACSHWRCGCRLYAPLPAAEAGCIRGSTGDATNPPAAHTAGYTTHLVHTTPRASEVHEPPAGHALRGVGLADPDTEGNRDD